MKPICDLSLFGSSFSLYILCKYKFVSAGFSSLHVALCGGQDFEICSLVVILRCDLNLFKFSFLSKLQYRNLLYSACDLLLYLHVKTGTRSQMNVSSIPSEKSC